MIDLAQALSSPIALVAEGEGFDIFDPNGIGNFLWTLLIFGLALPLMWKFVFGPISAALLERDAKANQAVDQAREASEAAEKARADVEVALGNANREAKDIIQSASQRAEIRERDIVDNAKKEAEAMIANARTQIEAERDKAVAQIREEVVDLSLAAASQVIGRNVGSDDDRSLAKQIVGGGGSQ